MKGKNKDNRKGKKLLTVTICFLMIASGITGLLSFIAEPVAGCIPGVNCPGDGDDPPGEIDLECFIAGTKVLMADGNLKNIEDVQAGDFVKSINLQNMQLVDSEVTLLKSDHHSGIGNDFTVKITFSDGTVSQCTNNHPYYVAGKGWASYRPDVALYKYGFGSEKLTIGDIVYKFESKALVPVQVVSISEVYESIDTYDLVAVHPNNNFFADGILVHNSGGGGDTTPPTISDYSPSSRSWSTSSIPTITVSFSDSGGLDFFKHEWTTTTSTPTFDGVTGTLSGTSDDADLSNAPVTSGSYYLHIQVKDVAANPTTGYSGPYQLDVTDPAAVSSWGGDEINRWTTDNNIRCSWSTPGDAHSGLDGYDRSWSSGSAANPGTSKNIEQTVTYQDYNGVASGQYYFNIRTKDNAGNWDNSYVSRGPYKIDVTDPSASISINDDDAMTTSTSVTLSCSYSDSNSDVSQVRYLNSGGSWSSWESATGSKAWTLPATDGTRTVYYEVKDNVGNVKQVSDTISYNIPPVADFTLSSSTVNCSETVTFTSTSSDEESISSYAWDLDNDEDTDFTSSSLDYTFNYSYAYTVKLTVTDNEGTATSTTKTLNVNDQRSFHGGKNFITWRKNSTEASALADLFIALENGESIQVFNDSTNTCDWDSAYIQGVSTEEDDFTINRGDVLKITLNAGRTFSYSFGSANGDLNTQVTKTLKYIDGVDSNHGYNAIQWTKEQRVRCSEIADDISLANGQTIFVHDATDTYKTYLKLPGNPTAGHPTLDPWVYSGDVFWVKVPKGTDISYDSQLIGPTSTLGGDDVPPLT